METLLSYIAAHWIEWLFGIITAIVGIGYKSLSARMKEEQKRNEAIAEGVQSLLRESIVSNYNKYSDKGFCPIYAKESIKKVYCSDGTLPKRALKKMFLSQIDLSKFCNEEEKKKEYRININIKF